MLKARVASTLDRVPLAFWRAFLPRRCVALYYHVVASERLPHVRHYRYKSPDQFEADVVAARDRLGFISHDEIHDAVLCGRPGGRRNRCLFTFDDGFAECLSIAAPILARHGAPAVFFVTTDFLGNQVAGDELRIALCIDRLLGADRETLDRVEALVHSSDATLGASSPALAAGRMRRARVPELEHCPSSESMLRWLLGLRDEGYPALDALCQILEVDATRYVTEVKPFLDEGDLRRLTDMGFTIGAHGCSHRRLQLLPPEDRRHEIIRSCEIVRDLTGQRSVPFAFPYSGRGLYSAELQGIREKTDAVGLYFDTGGLSVSPPGVVARVWADVPDEPRTNLTTRLRQVWWREGRRPVSFKAERTDNANESL